MGDHPIAAAWSVVRLLARGGASNSTATAAAPDSPTIRLIGPIRQAGANTRAHSAAVITASNSRNCCPTGEVNHRPTSRAAKPVMANIPTAITTVTAT